MVIFYSYLPPLSLAGSQHFRASDIQLLSQILEILRDNLIMKDLNLENNNCVNNFHWKYLKYLLTTNLKYKQMFFCVKHLFSPKPVRKTSKYPSYTGPYISTDISDGQEMQNPSKHEDFFSFLGWGNV